VFAVGRPQLTRHQEFMAAVLACGAGAALSHHAAAELYKIRRRSPGPIEVSVPNASLPRRKGIRVHRRTGLRPEDVGHFEGVPVTSPACTIVDLAPRLTDDHLEAMVSEADVRGLIDPDALRAALDAMPRHRGVGRLKRLLDRRTYRMSRSTLERRFRPIAEKVGLPPPETCVVVNGFEVDFYWPELGLVVETDGLRYHRTPQQQARDGLRNQVHAAAGLTPLRFTHGQIRFEPDYVVSILGPVVRRLAAERGLPYGS
jgi:very-short-patch-repair endonuclease